MIHETKKSRCIILIVSVFAIMVFVLWDVWSQDYCEQQITKDLSAAGVVAEGWESLFDGETLSGWKVVHYKGGGYPCVRDGVLILPAAVDGLNLSTGEIRNIRIKKLQ